jgi:transcriptional antiterminator
MQADLSDGNPQALADFLGCSRRTIYNYREREKMLLQQLEQMDAKLERIDAKLDDLHWSQFQPQPTSENEHDTTVVENEE